MIWQKAILALSWLILAGIVAQFYFVGLVIFGVTGFTLHAVTGTILIPASLILTVMIVSTRSIRPVAWPSLGLFLLAVLQPVLVFLPRAAAPAVSALHSLVALAILYLAFRLTKLLATGNSGAEPAGGAG